MLIPDSGIFTYEPTMNSAYRYRQTLSISLTAPKMNDFEVLSEIIPTLGQRFRADQYDSVLQNANHFSDELLHAISHG